MFTTHAQIFIRKYTHAARTLQKISLKVFPRYWFQNKTRSKRPCEVVRTSITDRGAFVPLTNVIMQPFDRSCDAVSSWNRYETATFANVFLEERNLPTPLFFFIFAENEFKLILSKVEFFFIVVKLFRRKIQFCEFSRCVFFSRPSFSFYFLSQSTRHLR